MSANPQNPSRPTSPALPTPGSRVWPKATAIPDLIALYRALETLGAVCSSLSCQPRLVDDRYLVTLAGREFDDIGQVICDKTLEVMDRLREAKARTEFDRIERAPALLQYDLGCDCDVTEVAVAAVEQAMPDKF